MKLLLRADANDQIGAGHVMRSLALARGLIARGGVATLVGNIASDRLRQRVIDAGLTLVPLDGPDPAALDLDLTARTLDRLGPRDGSVWAALDGYDFDAEYQRAIRQVGFPVLVIDDVADRAPYNADLLLNQNLGADELEYRGNAEMRLLRGVRYALLHPEFVQARAKPRRVPGLARHVLVTVGGADPSRAIPRLLRALDRTNVELDVVVAAGAMRNKEGERSYPTIRHSCTVRRDAADMAALMEWADLAITAAGTTCWELCCVGVPSIVIQLAENQRRSADFLAASSAAELAGTGATLDEEDLARRVDALCADAERRRSMSDLGRELVDGQGVARVLRRLGVELPRLALRRIEQSDVRALWQLANEPSTREQSFDPSPIPWETHVAWFDRSVASSSVCMWALVSEQGLAGQIRYEAAEEDAEIGISVAPEFRGYGLAARLLASTWVSACRELGTSRARGVVFATNSSSAAAFREGGFIEVGGLQTIRDRVCRVFTRTLES